MAKKESNEHVQEIKELIAKDSAVVGSKSVIAGIKNGSINKVFLARNVPEHLKEDIMHYANLSDSDIEVVLVDQDNEELGIICKKNFFVAVIGSSA